MFCHSYTILQQPIYCRNRNEWKSQEQSIIRLVFCEKYPPLESAFESGKQFGKYQADLYAIARYILGLYGVKVVLGGDQCSYRQSDRYYSYRRDPQAGRMASFAFMA